MSVLHESGNDDQQLVRYLLGLLPDEDAERIDELTITDDEAAWRVRAVEQDLVDAYVRGTLDPETRQRFEVFYLSSPRRREKVRLAENFLRAADAAGAPVKVNTEAGRDSVRDAVPGPAPRRDGSRSHGPLWYEWIIPSSKPAWGLALAAALLLLASGALLVRDARLRTELAEARQAQADLDRRAQDAARELERARASLAELSQRSPSGQAPLGPQSPGSQPAGQQPSAQDTPASRALTTVAMVLLPQTRAAGPIATLTVPPGTDRVAFELGLESNGFSRYQVALKDPATNQIVWRSSRIAPKSSAEASTLSVSVPASIFKPQHYSLDLTGFRVGGDEDVVGSYTFRVVRR